MHFLSCFPFSLSWLFTKAKQSGKCQLPPGFYSENVTNSVLSPGQAVWRELCSGTAAGQRATARTGSTVSQSCTAAEPYLAMKCSCHLAFLSSSSLYSAQNCSGKDQAANVLLNICPGKCPNPCPAALGDQQAPGINAATGEIC